MSRSTGDPNIAIVDGFDGTVFAVRDPGITSVIARWTAYYYQWNPNNEACDTFNTTADGVGVFQTDQPQPHHVRVLVDQGGYDASCSTTGVYLRQILVQIVNQFNRPVTRDDLNISETLSNISANTCGTGTPSGSACAPNFGGGQFIDSMTVSGNLCGSGVDRNSGCGYTLNSLWRACAGGGTAAADIWRYSGQTRSNGVTINGNANGYTPGTELFP
jgi:hypothetical protein